eukprot:TRINITY_DN15127_c0_g1_i1.p1 TRINITY_DN15127_c0_g1~~TRINITY_DN15127_c0_g1_i1.p1  ORF type:complete len:264 (-),score=29.47 TRINITY_DN15127_c0_g1_i1:433-1224(-)
MAGASKKSARHINKPTLPPPPPDEPESGTPDWLFLFHLITFLVYLFGLCWHVKVAYKHSLLAGFGYFSKYLSFWVFVAQAAALFFSLLSHIFPQSKRVSLVADQLSSAIFGQANAAFLGYGIFILTHQQLEQKPPVARPPWLSLIVHLTGAPIAWGDLLSTTRKFTQAAYNLSVALMAMYITWVLVTIRRNWLSNHEGAYPYPFVDDLPQPEGFALVIIAMAATTHMFHNAGAKISVGEWVDLPSLFHFTPGKRGRKVPIKDL